MLKRLQVPLVFREEVLVLFLSVFFFFFFLFFFFFFFFFFFNVDDFLAARHVGSQLPDQGLNPHPLHCKGES